MQAQLRSLADRLLTHDINNSAYDLGYEIARQDPVLVPRLLAFENKLAEKIAQDFVFGSCFLFASKPTHYQVPFFRALEKLQPATVLWPRQSGKTFSYGVGANLVALTRRNAQILVISASMRQSLILRRKMNKPFNNMHKSLRALLYDEILKTSITSKIGSSINFESCLSEDNIRGYSADLILGDEVEYWPNADYLYNEVLDPMFNTTNGAFVPASTPKSKSGLFYKLCTSDEFLHLHATWLNATWAGIMTPQRAAKIKARYLAGQISEAAMQTEYWANFFDDASRVLPYDKIIKCVSHDNNYEYYGSRLPVTQLVGDYFTGTDLGKLGDHAVVVLVQKLDNYYCIRHLKMFDLGTPEDEVIKYHETLAGLFTIRGGLVDGTNNTYWASKIAEAISTAEVVKFSKPFKQETARILGDTCRQKELVLPQNMFAYYDALNSINRETLDTDTEAEHSGNSDQFWATGCGIRAALEHRHGIVR